MALVPVSTRNRVSPINVSTIEQVEPCTDPNCSICRGRGAGRHHKYHHHQKRHQHHHHKRHKSSFWNSLGPRGESASSIVSAHSVELNEYRPYYNTQVTERALVPINQTERQVVTTTRTRPFTDDDVIREAWVNNPTSDDEIVCCRAYNGCRCPCWCCIIFIIILVILLIILIVLLATLL